MSLALIDVRDLVGHPGTSKTLALAGTVESLGTELARVPEDLPIGGDLLLESVVEGILVSGSVEGILRLQCARCLKEFEQPFSVAVHELFVEEPDPDADDYPLQPEGELNPEQMVRDVVGVELPFSPLCKPDCLGLCATCGGDKNAGECPGHAEIDPRWDGLEHLLEQMEQ
ncbi:MAG: hypothetical protein QOE25_1197 [Actinomycetota bacterium]|nr:hypothetical protein [Actinomycetota bacterium]